MNKTGYRGVQSDRERFQACCNLNHSRQLFLGRFATVEEAAAAFLQHWEKDHPEQLEKARRQEQLAKERVPRPVLLQVQQHLLIRSDKAKSGYKGVHQNKGRYEAGCTTSSCHHNHLGSFGTTEEAAQAYLQHHQVHHLVKGTKRRHVEVDSDSETNTSGDTGY